ncbi:MAG TPA: phosphotransferase [Actinomycetota bacterium]|nr:phosphotransferase [Actinomycetota bacterium]
MTGPNGDTERIAAELRSEVAELGWWLDATEVIGGGLEFVVFGASIPELGRVALRVPRMRVISNDNDPHVDAFALLAQEEKLLRHAREAGVPAPAVHGLHRGRRCDFLATALIVHDGSPPDRHELGRVVRRLHDSKPPGLQPVMDALGSSAATLAERIIRRAAVIERVTGIRLPLPREERLTDVLQWAEAERRLLHMDLRPENVLTVRGKILGIVDWSNAMLGDPALELARVSEYGGLDSDFSTGYGPPDPLARAPRAAVLGYRLDAAVMLAVVFLSEAPDPDRASDQVRRVVELTEEFRGSL